MDTLFGEIDKPTAGTPCAYHASCRRLAAGLRGGILADTKTLPADLKRARPIQRVASGDARPSVRASQRPRSACARAFFRFTRVAPIMDRLPRPEEQLQG